MTDKRTVQLYSASVFAVLLLTFLVPLGESGRIVAAVLLLPTAVLVSMYIKKRNILSINKNQIVMILTVIALVYVMLYYLSGLRFGFYNNLYKFSGTNLFKYILPIATIIVTTEIIRWVMLAQKDKTARILCYISCVIAEMLIISNIPSVTSFSRFMTLIAGGLFPALVSNALYNYLSARYGFYPNISFRLITTLHAYILPITSGISDSLLNFLRLLLPIAIFLFIDSLYEKKVRYALGNTSRIARIASIALTTVVIIIMVCVVMLVSNQFRYGSYVIATESMTGEIDKGDIALYERFDDQHITEGQVIAFEKNSSVIIHRVVDIQIINGQTRYFTKGDANEDMDAGFITDGDIIGLVNHKLPFLGYPTLWMRSLFKR